MRREFVGATSPVTRFSATADRRYNSRLMRRIKVGDGPWGIASVPKE